jgi:hypothetical protein
MSNDVACKAADYCKASEVKGNEIVSVHFLGLAYPNTPATIAPRIER